MVMAKQDRLSLRVGDEHPIELDSDLTSGYFWEPQVEGDESVAEVTKGKPEATPNQAIGASPPEVFKIKAVRPGKTTVRFAQRRAGDPPDQEIVMDVNVEE
jgi:predicted secreted protein